jgi:hypothetical protein
MTISFTANGIGGKMFYVQLRDESRRWKNVRISHQFAEMEDAIKRVTSCDMDGLFLHNMRIVDKNGEVVMDHKRWREHAQG